MSYDTSNWPKPGGWQEEAIAALGALVLVGVIVLVGRWGIHAWENYDAQQRAAGYRDALDAQAQWRVDHPPSFPPFCVTYPQSVVCRLNAQYDGK